MALKDSDAKPRYIYLLTGCTHLADAGSSKLQLNQSKFKNMFDNLSKTMSEAVCIDSNGDYSYTWSEIKSMLIVLGLYLKKKLFCCSKQMILDRVGLDARADENVGELDNSSTNETSQVNGGQQSNNKAKGGTTTHLGKQLDLSHFNTIFKKSLTTLTTLTTLSERVCPDRHDCDLYTWEEVQSTLIVLGLILGKNLFRFRENTLDAINFDASANNNNKDLPSSGLKITDKPCGGKQDGNLDITAKGATAGSSKQLGQPNFGTTLQSLKTSVISKDAPSSGLKITDKPDGGKQDGNLDITAKAATAGSSKQLDQPNLGLNSKSLKTSVISKDSPSSIVEDATAGSSKKLGQSNFGTTLQSLKTSVISKDLPLAIVEGATAGSSKQLDQAYPAKKYGIENGNNTELDDSVRLTMKRSVQNDVPGGDESNDSDNGQSSLSSSDDSSGDDSSGDDSSGDELRPQSKRRASKRRRVDSPSSIVEGATAGSSKQLDQSNFGTTLQSLKTSGISKDAPSSIVEGATAGPSKQLDQPNLGLNSKSLKTSVISKDAPSSELKITDKPDGGKQDGNLDITAKGATARTSKQLNQPNLGLNSKSLKTSVISKDAPSSGLKITDKPNGGKQDGNLGSNSKSLKTSVISKDSSSSIVKGATSVQLRDAAPGTNSNVKPGTNSTQLNGNELPGNSQNCHNNSNNIEIIDISESDYDLSEKAENETHLQTSKDLNSAKKYGIGNGNNTEKDGSVRLTMKRPVQNDVPVGDESNDSDNSSQSSLSSNDSVKRLASKRIRVVTSGSSEDEQSSIYSEKLIDIDKFCKLLKGRNAVSSNLKPVILDTDADSEQILVQVDKGLLEYLKCHQVEGVKFLYDNTIDSVKQLKKGYAGSGCILAHSMGLGKTLQIVTLLHTVLTNEHLRDRIRSILVIVPLIVACNWIQEFEKWISKCENDTPIKIVEIIDTKTVEERVALCERWHREGGVMIITKYLFTLLVNEWKNKNDNRLEQHQSVLQCLAGPGPDMVIIDEGHQIKNDKSKFHQALLLIRTDRRVILSGTPLQNNLSEYFTMVDFVRKGRLGNKSEFKNRFEDPITHGQHIDSSPYQIDLMKKRVYVLHKVLEDCIHRRDYNVLVPYLKSKSEQVLCLKLTPTQTNLYRHYLDNLADRSNRNFLSDFSNLHCIWSHPVLLSEKDETQTDPATGEPWWRQFMPPEINDIELSAKFILMISILERCQKLNDKILIFSKSLLNLDLIEKFLKIKTEEFVKSYEGDQGSYDDVRRHNDGVCHYWRPDIDYFRIDGKVKSESRSSVIDQFNEPQNQRARLMLVSTRAGGIGINLVGANRCIIFDVSWNPSHDLQAIYRIFRFGQEKPVYVYRFVASGTMESKVYKRQIVKESLSRRVIDQHNIRSQYSASELQELYRFTDSESERQVLNVPNNDSLLAGIMESHGQWIISNHQQDSLLENDPEQALTQAERQLAMDEYRREIVQMQDSDSE